jgi:putative transposase
MTEAKGKLAVAAEELLKGNPDGPRELVRVVPREALEAEVTDALGAAEGERTGARLGYRAGYDGRTLIARAGEPEPRVPRDRDGRFSAELLERYRRSERALVASLAEMCVQGVSARKVKAVTEEPCGRASSASAVDERLDEGLAALAGRRRRSPTRSSTPATGRRARTASWAAGRCWSPSASTRRGAGRSRRWSWRAGRAAPPGRTSSSG